MHRHRQRLIMGVALGLFAMGGWPAAARAGEQETLCPICKRASSDTASYPSKAGNTLIRGTANALLGWTEIIRQPAQEVKAGGNVFTGIAKGAGQGVKRTLAGAGEVLTFWTPKVQHRYVHFADDCPVCMGKR